MGPRGSNSPTVVHGGPRMSAPSAGPLVGPAIYVSAIGGGTGAAIGTPTTWTRGIEAARRWVASGGTPTVHVLDSAGPIWLAREASSSLALDARLSGATIQAHAGHRPVLSGGADLTGTWSAVGGGVYEATYAGPMAYTPRQLYVAGRSAELARTERHPAGFTVNLSGGLWDGTITAPDSSYASSAHPTDLRVALVSSYALWRYAVIRVVSIVGTTITCHPSDVAICTASWPGYGTVFSYDTLRHFEGLFEFVPLREGSFACHLNNDGSVTVRYRPRPGEVMSSISTILPVLDLETGPLLLGGTQANPASGITLSGFRLRHWGWSGIDAHGAICHGGDRMLRGAVLDAEASFYVAPGAFVTRWATGCTVADCVVEHNGAAGLVVDVGTTSTTFSDVICAENAAAGARISDDIRTVNSSHPAAGAVDRIVVDNCLFTDNARELLSSGQCSIFYTRLSTFKNSAAVNGPYGGFVIGRAGGANDPVGVHAGQGRGVGFPDPSLVPGGAPWTTEPTGSGGNLFAALLSDVSSQGQELNDGGGIYINGAARSDAHDELRGCASRSASGFALYLDNGAQYIDVNDFCVDRSVHGVNSQILSPPAVDISIVNAHLAWGATINSPRQPTVVATGTDSTVGQFNATGRAIADAAGLGSAYRHPELTNEHATAWASSYVGLVTDYGPQLALTGYVGPSLLGWKSAVGDPSPTLVIDCGIVHDVHHLDIHLADDTANFVVEGASRWDFSDSVTLWTQGATPITWQRPVVIRAADRADLLGSYRFLRIRSTSGAQLQVLAFRPFGKPSDPTLLSGSIDFTQRPVGPWQTPYDGKVLYPKGTDLAYRNSVARAMSGAGTITASAAVGVALHGAATDGVAGLVIEGAYPSATGYLHPSTLGTAGSGDTYTPVSGPDGTTATADRVQVTSGGYAKYGSLTSTSGQKFTLTRWLKQSPADPGGPWHGEVSDGGYKHQQGSAPSAWTAYSYTWTSSTTGAVSTLPFDTRSATSPPPVPVTWPHAIDVYGGPVIGVVRAESLITVAVAALATTTLTDSAGYRRIVGGRCKPTIEIGASMSSANLASARYLLVDQDDATTFVRVNADRTVTVSVTGTAVTLPTAIPAWTIAAGQFAKAVTLSVDFGAGSPSGSVTIDGVTASLGTGRGSHSALTTEKWWVLSNNGASVVEGLLRKLEWRA